MPYLATQRASTMPSSSAITAPCASIGSMEWQASPSSVTRPRVYAGIGGRENSAHL
jgi:hypothetical protein